MDGTSIGFRTAFRVQHALLSLEVPPTFRRSYVIQPLLPVHTQINDAVSHQMNILKSTTTPFAIKSGGHTFNQGFSSTTGVHIALSRLNGVTYNSGANTVTLGMGGICMYHQLAFASLFLHPPIVCIRLGTNVYAALQPLGVTVSGGRIDGVGVGGYLLGGGYSYLSSEVSLDFPCTFTVAHSNSR